MPAAKCSKTHIQFFHSRGTTLNLTVDLGRGSRKRDLIICATATRRPPKSAPLAPHIGAEVYSLYTSTMGLSDMPIMYECGTFCLFLVSRFVNINIVSLFWNDDEIKEIFSSSFFLNYIYGTLNWKANQQQGRKVIQSSRIPSTATLMMARVSVGWIRPLN